MTHPQQHQPKQLSSCLGSWSRSEALGVGLLLSTAAIWTVSSFLTESLVGGSQHPVPPLLVTYLATSLFTVYLPLAHVQRWAQDWRRAKERQRGRSSAHDAAEVAAHSAEHGSKRSGESDALLGSDHSAAGNGHITSRPGAADGARPQLGPAFSAAVRAAPLWFAAQLTFNMSLAYTSVTSNTILSSSSSLFTFLLAVAFLGERFTRGKVLCILACMAGTGLVTFADESSDASGGSMKGDFLVLLSAALYGAYTVVMRKHLPDDGAGHAHVAEFFGYVGMLCTLALAPLVGALVLSGRYVLTDVPPRAFLIILLEGLLDYALADYLWAKAVFMLGPTIATLGMSMQIPMAAVAELFIGAPKWTGHAGTVALTLGGTGLILGGFVGVHAQEPGGAAADGSSSGGAAGGHSSSSSSEPSRRRSLDGVAGEGSRDGGSADGWLQRLRTRLTAPYKPLQPSDR